MIRVVLRVQAPHSLLEDLIVCVTVGPYGPLGLRTLWYGKALMISDATKDSREGRRFATLWFVLRASDFVSADPTDVG